MGSQTFHTCIFVLFHLVCFGKTAPHLTRLRWISANLHGVTARFVQFAHDKKGCLLAFPAMKCRKWSFQHQFSSSQLDTATDCDYKTGTFHGSDWSNEIRSFTGETPAWNCRSSAQPQGSSGDVLRGQDRCLRDLPFANKLGILFEDNPNP